MKFNLFFKKKREFKVGGFYRHINGDVVHVIGKGKSLIYGNCFIAEMSRDWFFIPLLINTDKWVEVSIDEYLEKRTMEKVK